MLGGEVEDDRRWERGGGGDGWGSGKASGCRTGCGRGGICFGGGEELDAWLEGGGIVGDGVGVGLRRFGVGGAGG